MAKSNSAGKTFGTRYGKRLREKHGDIVKEQRKRHVCPYCKYTQVRRRSAGIWECAKCSAVFTGRAYTAKENVV